MTLPTRIDAVASLSVALAVLAVAVGVYLAVRADLRGGEVDTARSSAPVRCSARPPAELPDRPGEQPDRPPGERLDRPPGERLDRPPGELLERSPGERPVEKRPPPRLPPGRPPPDRAAETPPGPRVPRGRVTATSTAFPAASNRHRSARPPATRSSSRRTAG